MTPYAWLGRILRIDLTTRKTDEVPTSKYADFIGGMGMALKILWDENPPDVDPFDPDNRLVFMTGPLTGTLAPTSGRMEICTKSPGTEPPMCTRSGVGGYWGPELKFAGYDGVIVKGKADSPVYVWIHDGQVDILDARELWGLDTFSAQQQLMKTHGHEVKTLCIGPAGENLVRFSIINSDTGYAAAKIGGGAVMGSKNLKAIVVRGTGGIKIAQVPRFLEVCRQGWELLHALPMRDFTCQGALKRPLEFARKYRKKFVSCFACPTNCRTWIEFPGLPGGEAMCAGAWWYQAIGSRDDRAIWEAKLLADKYGVCAHTVLDILRWLNDSYKAGLISEQETGIQWSQFGSLEFIQDFLGQVTFRKGFGDIIAEGPVRALKHVKPALRKNFGLYFPAYGQSEHYELRAYPMYLMQWAMDTRDPLIDAHEWSTVMSWQHYNWPESQGKLSYEQVQTIGKEVYGSELAFDARTYDYKAETLCAIQHSSRLKNSLVVCDWLFPVLSSANNPPNYQGDPDLERKLFCTATGVDMGKKEWDRTGERICNMERALVVRDNKRTRSDDTVDQYYFETPVTRLARWAPPVESPITADRAKFEAAKDRFYELRSWDQKTGRPTKAKLLELGLADIAAELEGLGLLPA